MILLGLATLKEFTFDMVVGDGTLDDAYHDLSFYVLGVFAAAGTLEIADRAGLVQSKEKKALGK